MGNTTPIAKSSPFVAARKRGYSYLAASQFERLADNPNPLVRRVDADAILLAVTSYLDLILTSKFGGCYRRGQPQ